MNAENTDKAINWTQMNTDKHRIFGQKNQRKKTKPDTDEHGYTRIRIHDKNSTKIKDFAKQ
jgi:hypothetical protein